MTLHDRKLKVAPIGSWLVVICHFLAVCLIVFDSIFDFELLRSTSGKQKCFFLILIIFDMILVCSCPLAVSSFCLCQHPASQWTWPSLRSAAVQVHCKAFIARPGPCQYTGKSTTYSTCGCTALIVSFNGCGESLLKRTICLCLTIFKSPYSAPFRLQFFVRHYALCFPTKRLQCLPKKKEERIERFRSTWFSREPRMLFRWRCSLAPRCRMNFIRVPGLTTSTEWTHVPCISVQFPWFHHGSVGGRMSKLIRCKVARRERAKCTEMLCVSKSAESFSVVTRSNYGPCTQTQSSLALNHVHHTSNWSQSRYCCTSGCGNVW